MCRARCGARRGRRGAGQGQRGQARAHLLPRLRQDGVRRVGHGGERARRQGGGRPVVVPVVGQLLRQVAVVAAGGLPPRPHLPSHEAHQPQGRGSRLGAHHLGRGHGDHRHQVPGAHRPVRRRVHLQHVRHVPPVGLWALCVLQVAVPDSQRPRGLGDLQGPPPPHGLDQLRGRLPMDGPARRAARLRAVGHRAGELQLRRQLPQPRGPHDRCRGPYLHRPAPVRLGQGGGLLAEPGAGHRRGARPGLAACHDRKGPGGLGVREALDRRLAAGGGGHGAHGRTLPGSDGPHRRAPAAGSHRHEAEDAPSEGERSGGRRQPPQVHGLEQERQRRRRRPGVLGRRHHPVAGLQPRGPHPRSDGSGVRRHLPGGLPAAHLL